jgi:predicted DNA-binding transcriptional regulator YafY
VSATRRASTGRSGSSGSPKIRRWTDLVAALLRHHYPIAFDQIAREVPGYGASGRDQATVKRMFERDKKELLRFGVPIQTMPDETGEPTLYTVRRTNFYLPYLSLLSPGGRPSAPRHGRVREFGYNALPSLAFEPDELAAVASAARRVRALGDPTLEAEAESAMRKLAFDMAVDAVVERDGVEPTVMPVRARADASLFAVLGDALRDRKRVSFAYHAIGSDAVARREVEPYGLFYLNGHWYLAGRDRERAALRNFRLSRMSAAEPNERQAHSPDFEVPATFSLREHARSRQAWELGDGDASEAVVEFARETGGAAAAARLGSPIDGQPARRLFLVRRMDAFARWLLSFSGDARPVSPPALIAEYEVLRRRTLALYEDGAPDAPAT